MVSGAGRKQKSLRIARVDPIARRGWAGNSIQKTERINT